MISAITCMAVAIYFEARNQPIAGQLAANSRSGAMASRKPYRIITHGEPPCE